MSRYTIDDLRIHEISHTQNTTNTHANIYEQFEMIKNQH